MKFQLLPLGARFEFEGKRYVKSGPMTASAEDGGQRMIPRYATLAPLDEPPRTKPARSGDKLEPGAVTAAFDRFYGECMAVLDRLDEDQQRLPRARLETARQAFLAELSG